LYDKDKAIEIIQKAIDDYTEKFSWLYYKSVARVYLTTLLGLIYLEDINVEIQR
jgi:hypothetical protein